MDERVAEVDAWDGQPRLSLSIPELRELYAFVPQWHAVAVGPPVPFGDGRRILVSVDSIFSPAREDALRALWAHVRDTCETERMFFIEDEWRVAHCLLVGGS